MRKTCRKHLSPPGSGSGRRSWRVLDLAHEKTHEPHPTNTFQNTSHARKLNIFSFVPSIAPSVRKRDIYRNLKIFPIPSSCIFIFSFEMVNRMFRACLHAWAKAVRCDLWALFLPVALPLCIKRPSRKLQHFKSIPGKKNSAETRNSEELKKKTTNVFFFSKTEKNAFPMPRHKRRASLSSEPGCEKSIDEDSQIPHGVPWINRWEDHDAHGRLWIKTC